MRPGVDRMWNAGGSPAGQNVLCVESGAGWGVVVFHI